MGRIQCKRLSIIPCKMKQLSLKKVKRHHLWESINLFKTIQCSIFQWRISHITMVLNIKKDRARIPKTIKSMILRISWQKQTHRNSRCTNCLPKASVPWNTNQLQLPHMSHRLSTRITVVGCKSRRARAYHKESYMGCQEEEADKSHSKTKCTILLLVTTISLKRQGIQNSYLTIALSWYRH